LRLLPVQPASHQQMPPRGHRDRASIYLSLFLLKRSSERFHAAAWLARLKNANRSALIWSALVVGMPCGNPGYTFSVAFFTIFAEIRADAPMGTIWSSSP